MMRVFVSFLVALLGPTLARGACDAPPSCEGTNYTGTFDYIERVILPSHGCTNAACHYGVDLNLAQGAAYDSLVEQRSTTVDGWQRVVPGQKNQSLLWHNLAAAVYPDEWQAPRRAMPLAPATPLTPDELELVRLWIEHGAPREGTVEGTAELAPVCLPPITIQPAVPLSPPANGVQFVVPPVTVRADSEHEVCFAQYYDYSDRVPAEYRSSDGHSFRFRRSQTRQTAMSHHLVFSVYRGTEPPDSPIWGEFVCWGGPKDGQGCDRFASDPCGEGVPCATRPMKSLGCVGFGPPDAGFGANAMGDGGAQKAASETALPDGVFEEIPLRGMILWNSHAYNLSCEDAALEGWLNYDFADPDLQTIAGQRITNTSEIFKMSVPAFQTQEVCHVEALPPGARLFSLSSHTHKRGKRFRIFQGEYRCQGGPNAGEVCSPLGADFLSPDICAGNPCVSFKAARRGDCDADGAVTVDEILQSVNIALGVMPIDACGDADGSGDDNVSVDELLGAVSGALHGLPPNDARDPESSLLYVNLVYDDPVMQRFSPPLKYGFSSSREERSLTFCSLYDNGHFDPALVKTRSQSVAPPVNVGVGGPCRAPTHCTSGRAGEACSGRGDRARNSSCDSSPGKGDGFCDACTLEGGVTTDDEMLVMLGQYFIPERP